MNDTNLEKPPPLSCRILSLDGGGSKGFYTIGILKEIEGMLGTPLCERFDLIFGTSTGAIIAALLALGRTVDDVHTLYKEHVPSIMKRRTAVGKSAALKHLTEEVFNDVKITDFKTGIGIVATHWEFEKPRIFKANLNQAHGREGTFVPFFGCSIAQAIEASCSAYPFFTRPKMKASDGQTFELADGGYCANNPTLYAIADALMALKRNREDLRAVSLGVGTYPEPKYSFGRKWLGKLPSVKLLQKTFSINTCAMEQLRQVLFKDVQTVRISDTFAKPELACDLLEHDLSKLDLLYQLGRQSFENHEPILKNLLG